MGTVTARNQRENGKRKKEKNDVVVTENMFSVIEQPFYASLYDMVWTLLNTYFRYLHVPRKNQPHELLKSLTSTSSSVFAILNIVSRPVRSPHV